uniref:E3 ubiquitin-protein ligase n=1 Tax=Homo sapiens TaxID=9606 RepID=A0A8I5QJE9_HUMAN
MADVDPDTLLEWLQMGQGDERDMQLIALEQLCMLLLMSDNVDRCFETVSLCCPGWSTMYNYGSLQPGPPWAHVIFPSQPPE